MGSFTIILPVTQMAADQLPKLVSLDEVKALSANSEILNRGNIKVVTNTHKRMELFELVLPRAEPSRQITIVA
jgi:hypothetical protein